MKADMTLIARLLEDVLPENTFFVVLVGEEQMQKGDENCGFATDLAPDDAIKMMEEMLVTMRQQKPKTE
jgi:hypothetical protein